MKWMIFIRVIGVEHPFGAAEPENSNIGIAVHDCRARDQQVSITN